MAAIDNATEVADQPRARWGNRLERAEARTAFFFLLPGLVGMVLFLVVPIIASVVLSFTNWKLLGTPEFVGVSNYVRLFTADPQFWPVLRNTLFFTAEYLVLNIIISLGLAVWISSLKMGQRWFRVVFFLPTFTPGIAVAIVWMLIFAPGGFFDFVMASLSVQIPSMLTDQTLAMQAVIIVSLWAGVGYNTVLFNAALDMVPRSRPHRRRQCLAALLENSIAAHLPNPVLRHCDDGDHLIAGLRPDLRNDPRRTRQCHGHAGLRHLSTGLPELPDGLRLDHRLGDVRHDHGPDRPAILAPAQMGAL